MTPEINDKITAIIDKLTHAAEASGGFVLEQAPQLAREIIRYEIYSSAFWVVFSLVILVLTYKSFYRGYKDASKPYGPDNAPGGLLGEARMFVSAVFSFIFLIVLLCNSESFIKSLSAPRLILLEYVRNFK